MTTEQTPGPEAEQTAQPPPQPPPEPPEEDLAAPVPPSKEERTMAMLAHLLGGILIVTAGYLGFLAPLIIWLVKKDEMPFVNDQAKEALNFQLMILIASVVVGVLTVITCGIGSVLYILLFLADIILSIMAAVKANEGEVYRYPFNLRIVK